MDNTLVYLIFTDDSPVYCQIEEPMAETFRQAVESGCLEIIRVEKDGRTCRYTGPQKTTASYWEEVKKRRVW